MRFINLSDFNAQNIRINLQHNQRTGKDTVYGEGMHSLAFVTPPCATNWPRIFRWM